MLRFIKENMASMDGIEIYPIISMLIFLTVFSLALWRIFRIDKKVINDAKNIPLED